MTLIQLVCFALVASVCGMSKAQSLGRVRNVVPVALVEQCPPCSSSSCSSCSVDDLSALLLLARALDDKPTPPHHTLDVDGIISKLINALVFTTTQNSASGSGYKPGQGQVAGGRNGNGQGLVDLDVLGPNGLLDLDVGGKKAVDVGLGGSPSSSTTSTSKSNTARGDSGNGQGLLDLHALGPRPNDVAELDLAGKKVLDVDLGNGNTGNLGGTTGAVSNLLNGLL